MEIGDLRTDFSHVCRSSKPLIMLAALVEIWKKGHIKSSGLEKKHFFFQNFGCPIGIARGRRFSSNPKEFLERMYENLRWDFAGELPRVFRNCCKQGKFNETLLETPDPGYSNSYFPAIFQKKNIVNKNCHKLLKGSTKVVHTQLSKTL